VDTRRTSAVVGLVSGSHVINHAYLLVFPPAFSLIGADFGVSLAAVALAVGITNGLVTAGQLPLGYVSDTYSHGAVLVGALAVGTAGCALAAVAPTYGWLLAAAALMGVGVAGHHPAHYPLISAVTAEGYRSRAYSAHGFAGAIGLALPFAVVPAAVALGWGWRGAFAAIAALGAAYTVVAAVSVRRLPESVTRAGALATAEREPPDRGGSPSRRAVSRIRGYGRTLASSPLVLLLAALWFVNSIAVWGIRSYAATLLDVGYGLDPATASAAASAMLVVGAVVLLGGGYLADRAGPMPLLFAGYGALVVLASVVATERLPLVAAVGVVLLLSATIDISRPARATLTDLASDRADVGKNFAVITLGVSGGGIVAPPVFGYTIETMGLRVTFLAVAATAAVALALSVAVARRR